MKNLIKVISSICLLVILCTCRKEQDPFTIYDNGNTIIPKVTKVISNSEFNSSLINFDSIDYTLTLKKSTTSSSINIGDIIISSVGDGLLRKVTSINQGQYQVKITTEEVSLSEAIQKADLDFGLTSSTKSVFFEDPEILYIAEGVKLNDNVKGNSSINELLNSLTINLKLDGDGNLQTLEDQILLSGTLSIDQSYNGNIKIDNSSLKRFYLEYNFEEKLNLSVTYSASQISLSKEILFLTVVSKQPIIIMVGPVPVIINPVLELFAGVNFNANSKITTSVNQTFNFKTGVTYESGSWTNFGHVDKSFTFNPPTLTANANAKVYIKPKLSLKFYGSIAPNLSTSIYTQLSASATDNPWWNLKAGIKGDIGVSMKILEKNILDLSTNLFDVSYPITQATGGKPLIPTLNTSTPTIIVQTSATVGGNVTSDGGATVTDCGIYWGTSVNPETTGTKFQIGSGIGAFSTSLSGLNPNTTYYVKAYAINGVGTAYGGQLSFKTLPALNNPPSIPSMPGPTNGAIAILTAPTLTWICSDPENDPLTYDIYLGTTNNPTTLVGPNLTTLSYSPSVLNAGTTYYWKVVVRDNHSNSTSGPVWSFTTAQNGTIPINGLVAFYPFNGNANDESGNGNNGTVNGATLIADRKGNPNSAFSFNGTSNYITVQNSTSLQLTTLASFNIWVLVPSGLSFDTRPAVGLHFFCKGATYGDKWANYSIQLTGQNGVIAFELNSTTGGQYNGVSTTNPFGRDSWHMITVVYAGGQVKFYIDGILTDTKTNSITSLATSSLPLYIGVRYTSVYTGGFTGKLDDFRIYNRALTDQEISALYNE